MCLERDADLLVVNDLVENSWVYAFSNRDQVDVWLGLRENVCNFDEKKFFMKYKYYIMYRIFFFRNLLTPMFGSTDKRMEEKMFLDNNGCRTNQRKFEK